MNILLTVVTLLAGAAQEPPKKMTFYIGTYTGGETKGIYRSELDYETGKLAEPTLAAEIQNPTFLAIHPTGKYLYAVGELSDFQGQKGGAVSAFSIDGATGGLTLLNQQSAKGGGPCHVSVDPKGLCAMVANYGGGSVASLRIKSDGSLAPAASFIQHTGSSANKNRQKEPHAHSINPDANGVYAFAADLGIDKVLIYKLDAEAATLSPHDPPHAALEPGSGPRHFAFHPVGTMAFVCNELTSTVTSFTYDPGRGTLKEEQTLSTLPADFKGNNSTAEVQVTSNGRWLYVSNRGHDSLAIFEVDVERKTMKPRGHAKLQGKTPRNFCIDPTMRYVVVAHQDSGTVSAMKLIPQLGALEFTGSTIKVGKPVCVKFLRR